MKPTKEAKRMTNKEAAALLEAIKIIVQQSENKEQIKKALDAIQSHLTR